MFNGRLFYLSKMQRLLCTPPTYVLTYVEDMHRMLVKAMTCGFWISLPCNGMYAWNEFCITIWQNIVNLTSGSDHITKFVSLVLCNSSLKVWERRLHGIDILERKRTLQSFKT